MLMATTLGVVVWLLVSRTRNPLRNPLIVFVMCLMTTLIGWLAILGVGFLFAGHPATYVSPLIVILAVVLGGLTVLVLASGTAAAAGLFVLPGAAILLLASWLAVVGLDHVASAYTRAAFLPWTLASAALAVVIYFVAAVQRGRPKGGANDRSTGVHRQDDSRRQDDV